MGKIIRRTLIITIHERWTFLWDAEQPTDSSVTVNETTLPSLTEIAQLLRKMLGLSEKEAMDAQSPAQVLIEQEPIKPMPDPER